MVRAAQRLVNSYDVAGIPTIPEDGLTGWTTVNALTRCLQHELGVAPLSDSFGPATLAALQARYPLVNATAGTAAIRKLLGAALYCKGYDGGVLDGRYDARVSAAVALLKSRANVAGVFAADGVAPKLFKAILTLDGYVVGAGGTEKVRSIQRWLNARYVQRRNFFVIPCDGVYSRDVQKALMLAVQFELGMSDDVANGVFGPSTQAGLRQHVLAAGSTGPWVQLFSAAMVVNQRNVPFTATFDAALGQAVTAFQTFVKLPATGKGDYQTWASLLVSTGDSTRRGTACDCVDTVTDARAKALYAAGYRYVGRYLTNAPIATIDKRIKPGELATIAGNGLRAVPIYQTSGRSAAYFGRAQGAADAVAATAAARAHGFKAGTRIYFSVDFDAVDAEVTSRVIPHFLALRDTMLAFGAEYRIGVYGPRNICSRLASTVGTSASFVLDMSTAYSGNLGYPLPANWAFDQISTITVGTGSGAIQIDNDIASGADTGQGSFNPPVSDAGLDVTFDASKRAALLADVQAHLVAIGVPERGGSGGDAATTRSTTEAFDQAMSFDALATGLARTLRMRKAAVLAPLLWELRKSTPADAVQDAGVVFRYTGVDTGVPALDDCTTGRAQIAGRTAIRARNFGIAQGMIRGTVLDPAKPADVWATWQQLRDKGDYNVSTVPLVLQEGANAAGRARLGLTSSDSDHEAAFARYNPDPAYGRTLIGLHRVFEKHFAPQRAL